MSSEFEWPEGVQGYRILKTSCHAWYGEEDL